MKRIIAALLASAEASHVEIMHVQHITTVLICRMEACTLVRASGKALIAKMKQFLQQEPNMNISFRNDFFYAMMWIFDPILGENDPNLPHLLSETGFFVGELQRATVARSKQYAANVLNGLANMVSYVGRRVVEPYYAASDVLGVIAHLLDVHPEMVNIVSAALLFGNYYMQSDATNEQMVARLQTMIPIIACVIEAAVTDISYGGRTWSPKGACEALSNLSQHVEFHQALAMCEAPTLLAGVLMRDWMQRANYITLGAEYYADALGYAARALWNLRFAAPLPSARCGEVADRLTELLESIRMSTNLRTCFAALRDTLDARRPIVCRATVEDFPFSTPPTAATRASYLVVCHPGSAPTALDVVSRHCTASPMDMQLSHMLSTTELLSAIRNAAIVFVLPAPALLADARARLTLKLAIRHRKMLIVSRHAEERVADDPVFSQLLDGAVFTTC